MKRKFLVFLLVIVFGTGQAMVFAEAGVQEAAEVETEPTEDRKPEADIGNTEETEPTTEESETETSTQAGDLSKDMEEIGGGWTSWRSFLRLPFRMRSRRFGESKGFAKQVMWFTSLVSRGENLPPLYRALTQLIAFRRQLRSIPNDRV